MMLVNTFQHIRGISPRKERLLWKSGITSWDDLDLFQSRQLSMFNVDETRSLTYESRRAFEVGDAEFFARKLERQEHYRIALSFPAQTMFLDIETTGLSRYYDVITLIGWSLGTKYDVYIKGGNTRALRGALSQAKAIVTFNGSLFDLPFMRKEFPDLLFPLAHIDLRFLAKRVELSGGQKLIEQTIGLERESAIQAVGGEAAPILWHKYRRGDIDALKLLISYNHADVEGLKYIFDAVTDRFIKQREIPTISSRHKFSLERSQIVWVKTKSKRAEGIHIFPYKGRRSPTTHLRKLPLRQFPIRVIGIDLTGSEQRPSGWCLLDGKRAFTKRLDTDNVIIEETLKVKPDLISIDSPLSLPQGRLIISDDDPGRYTYGIMRYCERVLKKRGINVYPSLIKSMQNLTARGIRLAAEFRNLGIPVIESYPGAAQDIMNIPRKRADLAMLKAGLSEFGIKGDYVTISVSHDELDAITSAVVGLFFLSGKFEALGNDEENYLIIPDVEQGRNQWKERMVVGLSGYIASGKTTAGRFLEAQGYAYGRYSLVLKDMLQARGIEVTRSTLQEIGEKVYQNPGQRWLCKQLLQRLPGEGNIVIDGLRHPEDHAFFIETFGPDFMHIYISAPEDIRRSRYLADGGSDAEFNSAMRHPVESHISILATLAHKVIQNVGTEEEFQKAILEIAQSTKTEKSEGDLCLLP